MRSMSPLLNKSVTGLLLRGTIDTENNAYKVTSVSPPTPYPNHGILDERQQSLAPTSPILRLHKRSSMSRSHM
jgi:hypothetical protein